jgi:hypothetical protein
VEAEETPEVEVEIGGGAGEAVPAPAAEASTSSNVNGSESVDAAGSAASAAAGVGQKKRESDGQQQQQQRGTQDRDLPPSKRARTCVSGVDAGRQRRLFGSITKTLSRFQEDTKKDTEAVSLCAPACEYHLCILMLDTSNRANEELPWKKGWRPNCARRIRRSKPSLERRKLDAA